MLCVILFSMITTSDTFQVVDRVIGGLYGVFLGDALGAPFEFRNVTPKVNWSGILLDHPFKIQFQYHALELAASAVTDDSEMTIQLLKGLLQNVDSDENVYNDKICVKKYLEWANMKNTPLGKNTRALMKGVTTVKGFYNRRAKIDTSGVESNGTLMRCFPLVILPRDEWKEAAELDATLTNDNDVNRDCSLIYLRIARHFVHGEKIRFKCKSPTVRSAIESALKNQILDVSVNKGWVVHALYVALITLFNATSFEDGMEFIHAHFFVKTDVDTIMAITGGLLGAKFGFQNLAGEVKTHQNIQKVTTYFNTTQRPSFTPELEEPLRKYLTRI
jgi:ADP-ribosyl-[dinitrogen reductase] hydrolase